MAFVLTPEPPLGAWLDGLDEMLAKSSGFFAGRPVILDVGSVTLTREGLRETIAALNARGIRILGLEGIEDTALDSTFPPVLTSGRPTSGIVMGGGGGQRQQAAPAAEPERAARPSSLLVEESIRSGQSIVYLEGDVTVLGSVGSGAEIVAGGSIHVYGALRGRALAGARGNSGARIFSSKNEAELLAIDSMYLVADDMAPAMRGRSVQVWHEDGSIKLKALD